MPTVRIPTPLRRYTAGECQVLVIGKNVSDALQDLVYQYPDLKDLMFMADGEIQPSINLFLAEYPIHRKRDLDKPLQENDKLIIVKSISGGCL